MATNDKSFTLTHEFDAPVEQVFAAWTNADQLAAWFAPEGYKLNFVEEDIRPGGVGHYSMTSKHGMQMWGKMFFREIIPPAKLVYIQCFSNETGGIERHPMNENWPVELLTTVMLDEKEGKTILDLTWEPVNASIEEINTFVDGIFEMNQAWGGTFERLSAYLTKR